MKFKKEERYTRVKLKISQIFISISALCLTLHANADSRTSFGEPDYKSAHPQTGFEINASPNAFGGSALTNTQGANSIYALNLRAEYQPAFIQNYGILGIGPSFTAYVPHGGNITPNAPALSLLGAGGHMSAIKRGTCVNNF